MASIAPWFSSGHQAEAHVGRLPHLLHRGSQQPRHALAAEFRVERQRVPAALDEFLVDVDKAGRGAHHAVLQPGAHLVALAVERRQAVAGELGRLLEHGVDRVVGGVLVARQGRHVLPGRPIRAARNAYRRAGRYRSSGSSSPQYAALGRFWRPARVFSATIMTDTVLLAIDGPRATITLNDPAKHNRLDPAGLGLLWRRSKRPTPTPDVRVTVITGAGEKTFCSGYDLGSIPAGKGSPAQRGSDSFERVMDRIEAMRMPTLCALNGGVYGGATDLALACDFRLGVKGMRFFMPAARFGLHYYPGGLASLYPEGEPELRQARFPAVRGIRRRRPAAPSAISTGWSSAPSSRPRSTRPPPSRGLAPLSMVNMKRAIEQYAQAEPDVPAIRQACASARRRTTCARGWRRCASAVRHPSRAAEPRPPCSAV